MHIAGRQRELSVKIISASRHGHCTNKVKYAVCQVLSYLIPTIKYMYKFTSVSYIFFAIYEVMRPTHKIA